MKLIVKLLFLICLTEGAIQPSIPAHLRGCYSGADAGETTAGAPRRLDVFLSLLRKLERNSQLDIRLFSAALLRSLRLDGIEQGANSVETAFVLPYRASAFQFNKYKILMDLFVPSQNLLDVDNILSLEEKCLLHRMLSSTVRRWERGDEYSVCPLSVEQVQRITAEESNVRRLNSRCPIEDGVVQTNWGDVSVGTLVAAIASSLEAQRVTVTDILNAEVFKADISEPLIMSAKQEWFSDIETLATADTPETVDISNIWVSTLAGDLAEVVVNQGPRVGAAVTKFTIGSNNKWNDTLLPRDYYIFPQNITIVDWHFTDSEIIAGIDGLILASEVPSWTEQRRTLRLSQIIEMYYSNEGASFNNRVRACNRQNLFANISDSKQLFTEASRFAHILSLRQGGVYVPVDEMDRISEAAVSAFMDYVPIILGQYQKECEIRKNPPEINLILATDSSWKSYAAEQFLSWIGGALDMDGQRSSLALVQANTGRWIVPPSNNLSAVFTHFSNYTDEWPTRLNLPRVISTTIAYSLNRSLDEVSVMASVSPSTVVLVVSPTDRPSTNDLERSRELMHSLRSSYFDVYFAYVSQDLTDFQNINNEYLDYSELFLKSTSSSIHDVIQAVDTYLIKSIIPTRIIGAQCSVNGTDFLQIPFEDFVLPTHERSYRIHPYYLRQQPFVNIQFRNDGHGRLLVCTWRGADAAHSCQTIGERDVHTFNFTDPCPSPEFCPPARFTVTALTSLNVCANNDCRFPNQVGYYIQHNGLRCLPLFSAANSLIVFNSNLLFSIVLYITLLLSK